MTEKAAIIAELGEESVRLPELVQQALTANDRIKYYFSLLQTTRQRADHPGRTFSALRTEREAAGVEDAELDGVVGGTVREGEDRYRIPHLDRILTGIRTGVEEMVRPFLAGDLPEYGDFEGRRMRLIARLPADNPDELSGALIEEITAGDRAGIDTLHLLLMDLHRALNGFLARLAVEAIGGARVYMLDDEDREHVRAFMEGLNRTAPLKFGHPGLGTTATRTGEKLVIQNDIGMTEAHVLVIGVVDRTVTITYTDVHMARLSFFQSLFDQWETEWSDTLSRRMDRSSADGIFHLSVGTFTAPDPVRLREFLAHLGSRLVFLIDWNRARKQLRNFLLNKDAIAVLRRAAEDEIGHRGFLELGGERLIYAALELAAKVPLRYGEPLHQILGREKTTEYLSWVLRTSAEGLLKESPRLLIQDEIRAELLRYFRSAQTELLEVCIGHATLTFDVASALQTSVMALRSGTAEDRVPRNARRAKHWEREADLQVSQVRSLSRRTEEVGFFFDLIVAQDDAIDYLEEGCFFSTLIMEEGRSEVILDGLEELSGFAIAAVREFIRALTAAQYTRGGSTRDEMQDFLAAANRVITIEQDCDEARRRVERLILTECPDYRAIRTYAELTRTIEESTNALMKAVFILHDNILEEAGR
ncbi:MAG: hypothetical protein ABFC38_05445 [Methanospirillum sp.]